MNKIWEIDGFIFRQPFTCLIAGPTQSGKTYFVRNILKSLHLMIDKKINRIIYCYSAYQPFFESLKTFNIEFVEGIPNLDDINASDSNLIILDDLLKECQDNSIIQNLFTVDSHHKNLSVFLLSQNLFPQGKCSRTISLNCHYIVVFNNPRDRSQIYSLARQMFPQKVNFLLEAYLDAVENRPHGYLFLDLKQSTIEKNRVQTNILPENLRLVYTTKK